MAKKKRIPPKLQPWIEAREKYGLSHGQVQMARELGLNPKKFGKWANHKQQPWKKPLPQYIEELYEKSFGKTLPHNVLSLEKRDEIRRKKKQAKKEQKREQKKREAENDT